MAMNRPRNVTFFGAGFNVRSRYWVSRGGRLLVASLFAWVAVAPVLSGCASSGAHSLSKHEQHAGLPGEITPNWQSPIDGIKVASVQAAQQSVNFPLVAMPGLGNPSAVLVTPDETPAATVVVVQYQTSSAGLVDIYEEATSMSPSDFQDVINSWVALNGKPGTEGTSTSVTLSDGLAALITTTADGSRSDIRWIGGGVEYTIRGPSLTQQDCTSLGSTLAAAASAATS